MDIYTPARRSSIMARIRSTGTGPEETLRLLIKAVFGRRRVDQHPKGLPGTPDFFVPSLRLAIFVDGCFFHGCPVHYKSPKTRTEFWQGKIDRNRSRDRRVTKALRCQSVAVCRIWEHDLRVSRIRAAQQRLELMKRRQLTRISRTP